MVLFVDLEDDDAAASPISAQDPRAPLHEHLLNGHNGLVAFGGKQPDVTRGETFRSAMTEAFQCYPIVMAVASFIDLNTLDSLARTSRQIHDGLIQYRRILLASTLHCTNEASPVDREETLRYRARAGNWYYMEDGRSYNGKSGDCARDLVAECRRCAEVICRNCAIKPPAPIALRERHRRLCKTCARAPIATLLKPPQEPHLDINSEIVQREVCRCERDGPWLCQPCGRSMRAADNDYFRIWRWRNHYGEVLGGLGTGIGDGDRGVICGREEHCCAAKEVEQETDCDAEDAKDISTTPWLFDHPTPPSSTNTPPATWTPNGGAAASPFQTAFAAAASASTTSLDFHSDGSVGSAGSDHHGRMHHLHYERTPTPQLGPGYERHEIEGIGGVVKRKLVRMVRVGACVPEYESERMSSSKIMGREVRGEARSWCGWCYRVIPGAKDLSGAPPSPEH